MFTNEDDEDDFSAPKPSSRLATLFAQDGRQFADNSFKFKAPKDPNAKSVSSEAPQKVPRTTQKTSVLSAFTGFCYKLINGQFSDPERLGVAVIGDLHNDQYSILIYVTKEKPVSFTRITQSLKIEISKGNYVSFVDEGRQYWSICFSKEEEAAGFAKQISLAQWMCGNRTEVLRRDLLLGEGNSVGIGDLVEIKIKSFRLVKSEGGLSLEPTNDRPNAVEKLKLGRKSLPEVLEDSVIGMKKLGLRVVIYAVERQGTRKDTNETIVEEIALMKVKFAKEKQMTRDVEPPQAEDRSLDETDSAAHSVCSMGDEELHHSEGTNKRELMSRIKKLGQPLLMTRPTFQENESELVKSTKPEEGEILMNHTIIKPEIRPKPRDRTESVDHPSSRVSPVDPQMNDRMSCQSFSSYIPIVTSGVGQTSSMTADPNLSYMMVEMRQQNLDLRTVVLKTFDKVESLSSKADDIQKSCQSLQMSVQMGAMSSSVAPVAAAAGYNTMPLHQSEISSMHQCVDRIFQDNENLRKELKEKDMKMTMMNDKMNHLFDVNQKLMQQNMESNAQNLEMRMLSDENARLKINLEELKGQLGGRQREISEVDRLVEEKSHVVKELKERLRETQDHLDKVLDERDNREGEAEKLRDRLRQAESNLEMERAKFSNKEQHMRAKAIEADRTISHLRETLMKKQEDVLKIDDATASQKALIENTIRDYTDRLAIQDEFHITVAKQWEEEKNNLLFKISETDRNYQIQLQAVLKEKNKEMKEIKDELTKLTEEYMLVKSLAKDLKEKYDWTVEQHQIYVDQTDSRIKAFMNNIYRCFKESVLAANNYTGSDVLSLASSIIKSKTLEMLSAGNVNQNNDGTSSSMTHSTKQPPKKLRVPRPLSPSAVSDRLTSEASSDSIVVLSVRMSSSSQPASQSEEPSSQSSPQSTSPLTQLASSQLSKLVPSKLEDPSSGRDLTVDLGCISERTETAAGHQSQSGQSRSYDQVDSINVVNSRNPENSLPEVETNISSVKTATEMSVDTVDNSREDSLITSSNVMNLDEENLNTCHRSNDDVTNVDGIREEAVSCEVDGVGERKISKTGEEKETVPSVDITRKHSDDSFVNLSNNSSSSVPMLDNDVQDSNNLSGSVRVIGGDNFNSTNGITDSSVELESTLSKRLESHTKAGTQPTNTENTAKLESDVPANEDDSVVKPPPFPDTDEEDRDWSL